MQGLFAHGDLQGLQSLLATALEAWIQQKSSPGWEEASCLVRMSEEAPATMTEVKDITLLISVISRMLMQKQLPPLQSRQNNRDSGPLWVFVRCL